MPSPFTVGIVSDIHYAGAAEQARGDDYEIAGIPNGLVRLLLRVYRRFVWLPRPLQYGYLLDRFLEHARARGYDLVVANGDFTCDTGFIGVGDAAARESVRECLTRLGEAFGPGFRAVLGDHELGKLTLVGHRGGMRLESYRAATEELRIEPFWTVSRGRYVLVGITSSLLMLPLLQADRLPEENPQWESLRAAHLGRIRDCFASLDRDQRVLLFCHDPSALPFLHHEDTVRARLGQIEQTIIGHLHSKLVLWKCRVLSGMPHLTRCGHSVAKFTGALNQARCWKEFRVRLCPSLAGIELLKDGGYYSARLDPDGQTPAAFEFHPLRR